MKKISTQSLLLIVLIFAILVIIFLLINKKSSIKEGGPGDFGKVRIPKCKCSRGKCSCR